MRTPMALMALAVSAVVHTSHANFAQLSGTKAQNIARQSASQFGPVWGHAAVLMPADAADVSFEANRRGWGENVVSVLGGDVFDVSSNTRGLTNEVWYTQNMGWRVVESFIDRTHFDALFPNIVSQTDWVSAVPAGIVVPPDTIEYHQYLCCVTTPVAPMWGCDPFDDGSPFVCDPFGGNRRWAPRRDHSAVAIGRGRAARIIVTGGRARLPNQDAPPTWTIGGAVPAGEFSVIREVSTLMSDVWISSDFRGSTWDLQTPGCGVHTEQFLSFGDADAACSTTADCLDKKLGTDGDVAGGSVVCGSHGFCVCTMWTPRERFAVALFPNTEDTAPPPQLFIAGGVTEISKQKCGEFACGGGNRIFLNDVWVSNDLGLTWTEVVRHEDAAARWHPRGDHTLIVVSGVLWLLGGRGGDVDMYTTNPLYNDVWTSPDGAAWTQATAAAEWSPRASHVTAYDATLDQVMLFGGEEFVQPSPSPSPLPPRDEVVAAAAEAPVPTLFGVPVDDVVVGEDDDGGLPSVVTANGELVHGDTMAVLDDVWVLSNASGYAGGTWVADYTEGTPQEAFVRPSSPLTHPTLNLSEPLLDALHGAGLATIQDFAHAGADVVNGILLTFADVDELCLEKARVEKVSFTCENQYVPYDGEFINTLTIQEGSTTVTEPTRAEVTGCAAPHPDDVPEELTDVECRQQPSARRAAVAAVVSDRVFVIGGYSSLFSYNDDLWYRDVTPPVTSITTFPESGSSDTVFEFLASECRFESSCLYEYRIFDEECDTLKRNWSRHTSPLDYKSWLNGGVYRMEFRGIDAAYNRDVAIEQGRNAYTWRYTPPLPWLLIILGILAFIILCIVLFVWYRRRKRKIALERYALKRARRKLKAAKAGDWRNHYEAGGAKKRKRKKRDGAGDKKSRSKSKGKGGKSRSKSKSRKKDGKKRKR